MFYYKVALLNAYSAKTFFMLFTPRKLLKIQIKIIICDFIESFKFNYLSL